MISIKTVNNELKRRGINAELIRGEGYFYFIGVDVEYADSTSVMVARINHLTLESWMKEVDEVIDKHRKVKELYDC